MVKYFQMTKDLLSEKKPMNVLFLYFTLGGLFIAAVHVYAIAFPQLLLSAPISGGLITWTHFHTLGVITPVFMGIGFYNLRSRYNAHVKASQVLHHALMLYLPLPFFLYFVFDRQGSLGLTLSAMLVFLSAVYYIYIYAMILRKTTRDRRGFEFWTDAVSLYFLFQAVLFGFVLAANLSYHFFRRDITHSIKLHSHSAIAGFWLLQFFNMIFRESRPTSMPGAIKGGPSRYLKYSVFFSGFGLFLWTSVHDRFTWFLYVFYFSIGLAIFFLLLYLMNYSTLTKKKSTEKFRSLSYDYNSVIFLSIAFIFAGYMIFSGAQNTIYRYHLPFIYMYTIFYGVFVFVLIRFLARKMVDHGYFSDGGLSRLNWAFLVYVGLGVLFVISIIYENMVAMRLLQFLLLIDFFYIFYFFYSEVRNRQCQ